MPKRPNPIDLILQILHGSQSDLARRLKVSRQTITHWRAHPSTIPPKRARELEAIAEGRITRYQIRPDVFGAAP
jgi:DNA-binding transcriptional regulator YdaS (Cro superfamily)